MITQDDLIEYFQGFNIPANLLALLNFDIEIAQGDFYSDGFEFSLDSDKTGLKTYSTAEEFLNSIYEFACADGSGSSYAFWLKDGNNDLGNAPVVVFGSEGGFHIVARNFNELLQILTFDSEPMIDWDSVSYYKDPDDFEPSSMSKKYRKWLKKECLLGHIDDANEIVMHAQKEYNDEFKNWVARFYKN
jgi:hypothetical protein